MPLVVGWLVDDSMDGIQVLMELNCFHGNGTLIGRSYPKLRYRVSRWETNIIMLST